MSRCRVQSAECRAGPSDKAVWLGPAAGGFFDVVRKQDRSSGRRGQRSRSWVSVRAVLVPRRGGGYLHSNPAGPVFAFCWLVIDWWSALHPLPVAAAVQPAVVALYPRKTPAYS